MADGAVTYDKLQSEMNEVVKNMCLFSAYTGLRHGDIIKLTWNNVIERNSELSVRIRMQKTQRELIVPI